VFHEHDDPITPHVVAKQPAKAITTSLRIWLFHRVAYPQSQKPATVGRIYYVDGDMIVFHLYDCEPEFRYLAVLMDWVTISHFDMLFYRTIRCIAFPPTFDPTTFTPINGPLSYVRHTRSAIDLRMAQVYDDSPITLRTSASIPTITITMEDQEM
jgi:hypothetical protein